MLARMPPQVICSSSLNSWSLGSYHLNTLWGCQGLADGRPLSMPSGGTLTGLYHEP